MLVPMSQNTCAADGWNTFEPTVENPYSTCTYVAPEMSIPSNALCRLYGPINASLLPAATGRAAPALEAKTKVSGGSYGPFAPWATGDVTCQAATLEVVLTTATGVAYISDFVPALDMEERTEDFLGQAIAAGGTAITYSAPFFEPPMVQATAVGSVTIAVPSNETVSGCTITLYNPATGASVAGTANITITG